MVREIIEPVLVLPAMEDVRAAVDASMRDKWRSMPFPYMFRIRSEWLVSLVGEIEASGRYPYNAVVKREACDRLGMPRMPEAWYAQEGDTLSLLIYNAQCFRASDQAKVKEAEETAAGWFRPTVEWCAAHVGERVEVLGVEGRARVGHADICPPRSRTKVYRLSEIKIREVR